VGEVRVAAKARQLGGAFPQYLEKRDLSSQHPFFAPWAQGAIGNYILLASQSGGQLKPQPHRSSRLASSGKLHQEVNITLGRERGQGGMCRSLPGAEGLALRATAPSPKRNGKVEQAHRSHQEGFWEVCTEEVRVATLPPALEE